ncbi:3-oxoacyl-[acyl-carrier-protein] reductase [Rickettsiales endosymbiont of Peranema trichophorum]|uniref:3-oxoacyl-[acyl-carrier-protein] reductase n=1 Tax=Rickettsiales endosymbiont of Peranema trichophorum TaxID=2486577 RepID=UPI001023930F|nr:3-oxoacyl-[acyl-carrier-protein] reductase [Rickettsiales endosymbiont of Peranema trichophorum]RZI45585.1 3-oxoacyl-[acyl-carrier-protein] reductase [Rickettsiales endosymbiont of Peranema trichophorum]
MLKGKTALITGATGGIGRAIAKAFCDAGANVILTGTRESVLRELLDQLPGDAHRSITSDLSDLSATEGLYEEAEALSGSGVDILVCNAGIAIDNLILRMKDEDWDKVMNVNLTATFRLNRSAVKKMMKRRAGRIINITSVVGHTGNFGQANYTSSKAAVAGMSRSIALEVASRGVTVNCIAPGFIDTDMTSNLSQSVKDHIIEKIPLQRMGKPEEIASAALFLASDQAAYITGTTIHVNGGLYMC